MPSRLPILYVVSILIALGVTACDQKPVDLAPETPTGQWRSTIAVDGAPAIYSVWSFGPTDVWVATSNGVERFDGNSWSRPTDQIQQAEDVWGSSPSDVYVTSNDEVWHYDGVGWSQTPIGGQLVTGTGSSDVYAVDFNRVFHFNGAEWDTILTSSRNVRFISALPGLDCIVSYADSLLRWDGDSWTTLSAPGPMNDLWRANALNWFAIGYDAPAHAVWHWDGVAWSTSLTIDRGFPLAIWGSGQDVFVSGLYGLLQHYDGVVWTPSPGITRAGLFGIGGSSSSDVYAVGHGGHVLRRDGESWASIHPIRPDLYGLTALWAATPTHAFFGSGDGTVFEYSNGVWIERVLGDCDFYCDRVYDIVGTSVDNVFASLGNTIARYDGSNWSVSTDSLTGRVVDMCALPSGHVFAAGSSGFAFDGAAWTRTYDGEREMRAVWARDPNCAYMVGRGVLHYDGNTWKLVRSAIEAYDVWGTDCGDIYVAHYQGIAHFDGVRWMSIEPYPVSMHFVIGNDRDGIIAVSGDTIFQLDGAFWRIETMEERLFDLGLMPDGTITGLAQTRDGFIAVSWVGSH